MFGALLGILSLSFLWPLLLLFLVIAVVGFIVAACSGRQGVVGWIINGDHDHTSAP